MDIGMGDSAPQTFLDQCEQSEQSEQRYRNRRGGGWDPRTFWDGSSPIGFDQSHGGLPALAGKNEMSKQGV